MARQDIDQVEKWRAEQKAYKDKALKFLLPRNHAIDMLIIMRVAMEPQVQLVNDMLYLSSNEWERQHMANLVKLGDRKYRIVELAKGALEDRLLRELRGLLQLQTWPVSSAGKQSTLRGLVFRLVARLGGAATYHLRRTHHGAPYKLFHD